jgi:hypothetical protein
MRAFRIARHHALELLCAPFVGGLVDAGITRSSITKRPSMITVAEIAAMTGEQHGLDGIDDLAEMRAGRDRRR